MLRLYVVTTTGAETRCGASVIGEYYALTAAHCFTAKNETRASGTVPGRIIGGSNANIENYPFVLRMTIVTTDGESAGCGASVIGEFYALTAAHCFYGMSIAKFPKCKLENMKQVLSLLVVIVVLCGFTHASYATKAKENTGDERSIIGGKDASISSYPFALLMFVNGITACSASVIGGVLCTDSSVLLGAW
ncbi:hypothetical protein AND_001226 [Anopheles darlingi]|uniref:Peptidase S1 domain-containing protein n=1 Tax=Anopheles darlingi TaxID=43151 RepID=W5JS88_ANODA|nr:hypothetical protein AND_001226 [Anopheles darlingi]